MSPDSEKLMEELIQEVTDDFHNVMVKDIGIFSVWYVCMSMLAEYMWTTGEPGEPNYIVTFTPCSGHRTKAST